MTYMRYTIGKTYAFIKTDFDNKSGNEYWSSLYIPWQHDLKEIKIVLLTCTEHHKVAWEHDPKQEKENDGFVFVDEKNEPWENQYPTASYGQLDDSMDRKVIWRNAEDFDFYTDAFKFLVSIQEALIADLAWTEDQTKQFREYATLVQTKIEEAIDVKLGFKPWTVKKPDGTMFVSERCVKTYVI